MKLRLTFNFFDTESSANHFCDTFNKKASYYIRKNKPAHFTPWVSQDGTEHKYIAWYYI